MFIIATNFMKLIVNSKKLALIEASNKFDKKLDFTEVSTKVTTIFINCALLLVYLINYLKMTWTVLLLSIIFLIIEFFNNINWYVQLYLKMPSLSPAFTIICMQDWTII